MAFLYGINFGVAALLTVLLLKKYFSKIEKRGSPKGLTADIWLLLYMAVSALIFLSLAVSSELESLPLTLKIFAGGSGFLLLPAFFFTYLLALLGKSTRWSLLFTVPFLFHFSWQMWGASNSSKYSFFHGLTMFSVDDNIELWIGSLVYLTQAIFPMVGLYQLDKHQVAILNRYSNLSDIDLIWVQRLLWSILVTLLFASLLVVPWGHSVAIPFHWSLPIIFGLISIQLIYIAYYGLFQSSLFLPTEVEIERSVTETDVNLFYPEGILEDRIEQLQVFVQTTKIFQQSRLSIDDLSQAIGWSVDDLSVMINSGLDKNFFEFINSYRVNDVISQIQDEKNQPASLLHIALHAGFNSKTAFNTTFKKMMGMTPSAYKKKYSQGA